ncbi:hypothetical protein RJ55_04734 [Drechmeria coniospora]|nr:hypothetical protein RJ55_04734 [Drechmeria coniospora]
MKFACLLVLAAAAVASPVGSVDDYVKLLEKRQSFVSDTDYKKLKFYVQHTSAAYCNIGKAAGDPVTCRGTCNSVERNQVSIVSTFVGPLTAVGGYIAVDHARHEITLAIRGSNNIRNFITDILFIWQNCDLTPKCKVHTGFATAWREISKSVTQGIQDALEENPSYKIIITGHSLGGAVATIATAYLRRSGIVADVYTFGTPRVGNSHFADFMTTSHGGQWRVTHRDDPVPRLPPIFTGYRHMSPEYWLSNGNSDQVDYKLQNIKRCDGTANVACNAGTFGFNIVAHLNYLGRTSGCAPLPLQWKRDEEQQISNKQLENRLNEWSRRDQEFVKNGQE